MSSLTPPQAFTSPSRLVPDVRMRAVLEARMRGGLVSTDDFAAMHEGDELSNTAAAGSAGDPEPAGRIFDAEVSLDSRSAIDGGTDAADPDAAAKKRARRKPEHPNKLIFNEEEGNLKKRPRGSTGSDGKDMPSSSLLAASASLSSAALDSGAGTAAVPADLAPPAAITSPPGGSRTVTGATASSSSVGNGHGHFGMGSAAAAASHAPVIATQLNGSPTVGGAAAAVTAVGSPSQSILNAAASPSGGVPQQQTTATTIGFGPSAPPAPDPVEIVRKAAASAASSAAAAPTSGLTSGAGGGLLSPLLSGRAPVDSAAVRSSAAAGASSSNQFPASPPITATALNAVGALQASQVSSAAAAAVAAASTIALLPQVAAAGGGGTLGTAKKGVTAAAPAVQSKSIASYFQPASTAAASSTVELDDASPSPPTMSSSAPLAVSSAPIAAGGAAAAASASAAFAPTIADVQTELLKLRSQATELARQLAKERATRSSDAEASLSEVKQLKDDVEAERVRARAEKAAYEEIRVVAARNLAHILKESAIRDASAARRSMAEKHARLGRVVALRGASAEVVEKWEDGDDFIALSLREAALKTQRAELERVSKDLTKRNKKFRVESSKSTDGAAAAAGIGGRKGGKTTKAAAAAAAAVAAAASSSPGASAGVGGDESDDSDGGEGGESGAASASGAGAEAFDGGITEWDPAIAALLGPFGSQLLSNAASSSGGGSNSASAAAAAASSSSARGGLDVLAELDLVDAEETVKNALAVLKREEGVLGERRRALELEKSLFILELKRARNEAMSRFRGLVSLQTADKVERYLLLELVGKGGFSEVWRAMDLFEVKTVAVKIHQLNHAWPKEKKESYVKHAIREYNIQRGQLHPNIVRLFGVIDINEDSFATVLEYCHGTDLDRVLRSGGPLVEREARAIVLQILSALRYLNGYTSPWSPNADAPAASSSASAAASMAPPPPKRSVIHYDLKPANILFDEFRSVKVTDFGLSKIVDEEGDMGDAASMELTSQGAGTYYYLPPETFQTGPTAVRISNKVDVWSLGVIFYQMVYGKRPFGEGQTQEQMLAQGTILQQAQAGPQFPPKPSITPEAKAFIRRCLTASQAARPDVLTLCEDPYLRMKLKPSAG